MKEQEQEQGQQFVQQSVAVVGLGRVGLPLALTLADRGYTVYGVDRNELAVQAINDGQCPYNDTTIVNALEPGKISAHQLLGQIDPVPDTILVAVPTFLEKGYIEYSVLFQTLKEINTAIQDSDRTHTVVILSTVTPGACNRARAEIFGERARVCYVPVTVDLGDIMDELSEWNFPIVGVPDEHAVQKCSHMFASDGTSIMSTLNAEIAKLAYDGYQVVQRAFANEIANLCEYLQGADIDEITKSLFDDVRSGGPTTGPYVPMSVQSLLAVVSQTGTRLPIVETAVGSDNSLTGRILQTIVTGLLTTKSRRVGILGVSYKPGVAYRDGSLGYTVARKLRTLGVTVRTYDPLGSDESLVKTMKEAVRGAGVVLVANADDAFKNLPLEKGQVVIDVWRLLDREELVKRGVKYIGLGIGEIE